MTRFLAALAACVVLAQPVGAAASMALEAGSYVVKVRLELPNLDDMTASKVAIICVSDHDGSGTHGLAVLSDNNPLAHCPVSNVRQDGDTLTFAIKCPGGNAAIASATYVLGTDTFQGRISMKMGGKNMTMTEAQSGRRTGPCRQAARPPS